METTNNFNLEKSSKAWFDKHTIGCASLEVKTIAGVDVFVAMYFGKKAHSVRTIYFISLNEAVASLERAKYAFKAIA